MSFIQQKMKITGELQIDGSSGYKSSSALINFIGTTGVSPVDLSQIRCFGFGGQYTLLLDASGANGGTAIRANVNEGDSYYLPTAKGDQYSLFVASNTGETKIKRLAVQVDSTSFANRFDGNPPLRVSKPNTSLSSTLSNSICTFTQDTWKIGETSNVVLGSTYSGGSVWSYTTPTTSSLSSLDNYGSLSTRRNGTDVTNMKMFPDGSVTIPTKLTATTISATTYENLPPVPPSDLLPITLDKIHNRVGISTTSPQFDLDVNGDVRCDLFQANDIVISSTVPGTGLEVSGEVSFPTLSKVTHPSVLSYDSTTGKVDYMDAVTDLTPITLDPAQNRVGIRTATPTTALDVNGTVSTHFLQLQSIPNMTQPDILMYDPVTKEVSYGPAPSPTPDLLPITLDKVNSRVGINNASPQHALDIVGGINLSSTNYYKIGSKKALAFEAIGATTVNVGSEFAIPSTATNAVAIGNAAKVSGSSSIAIGYNSGNSNTNYNNSISIGPAAGRLPQNSRTIAIGINAGEYYQNGDAIAIGYKAGAGNSTATSTGQGSFAIALGYNAGSVSQGNSGIAIGNGAGNTSQGANTIAIGQYAGMTNQHISSIILNATGLQLNSTNMSSFYVKPVRQVIDASMPRLSYNATTGEIMYGNSTTDSLLPITLDKTNNRVGINKTVPTQALDVVGTATMDRLLVKGTLANQGLIFTDTTNNRVGVGTITPATALDVMGTTTTTNLQLTGIANSAKANVLMYDTTTKEVTYGSVSVPTPTQIVTVNASTGILPTDAYTTVCSTSVAAGTWAITATVVLSGSSPIQDIQIEIMAPGAYTKKRVSSGTLPLVENVSITTQLPATTVSIRIYLLNGTASHSNQTELRLVKLS